MAKTSESSSVSAASGELATVEIDLRNPRIAALLGWLWPGAGHLYQKRYAKGMLFMICVLAPFFFGLAMGGGRVVYASLAKDAFEDGRRPVTGYRRLLHRGHYWCQLGVGLPAFPAIVERVRADQRKEPLFGGAMSPPDYPDNPYRGSERDTLAEWHYKYKYLFDMGSLYTVIAGLLNILAIYDAYAGPYAGEADEEDEEEPPPTDNSDNAQRSKQSTEGDA